MKTRFLLLVTLLGIGSQVFSAGAATVLYTNKNVYLKTSGGGKKPLSRGASLSPGDTIVTESGASVNIKYTNGTLVNLGENTDYSIVAYNPKQETNQIQTKLNTGKLRLKTTGKTNEEITTPIVALGILGTDTSIYVASSSALYVQVTEGKVEGKGASIGAGDSVLINNSGVVPTPFPQEGNVVPPTGAQGNIATATAPINTVDTTKTVETISLTTTQTVGTTTASTVTTTTGVIQVAEIMAICP